MIGRILTCGGIGESLDRNLLTGLVRELPELEHIEVDYPASYGPVNRNADPRGDSFDTSLAGLYQAVSAEMTRDRRTPTVLAGYSAGAAGVGNMLSWMPDWPNLIGAVLVADPMQPDGGIAGSRPITGWVPVRCVSNPRDIICECPDDSPLRIIAQTTPKLALGSVPEVDRWGRDVVAKLQRGAITAPIRNWRDPVGEWRRYQMAIDGALGYLGRDRQWRPATNQHQVYRSDGSLRRAADWVRAEVL